MTKKYRLKDTMDVIELAQEIQLAVSMGRDYYDITNAKHEDDAERLNASDFLSVLSDEVDHEGCTEVDLELEGSYRTVRFIRGTKKQLFVGESDSRVARS